MLLHPPSSSCVVVRGHLGGKPPDRDLPGVGLGGVVFGEDCAGLHGEVLHVGHALIFLVGVEESAPFLVIEVFDLEPELLVFELELLLDIELDCQVAPVVQLQPPFLSRPGREATRVATGFDSPVPPVAIAAIVEPAVLATALLDACQPGLPQSGTVAVFAGFVRGAEQSVDDRFDALARFQTDERHRVSEIADAEADAFAKGDGLDLLRQPPPVKFVDDLVFAAFAAVDLPLVLSEREERVDEVDQVSLAHESMRRERVHEHVFESQSAHIRHWDCVVPAIRTRVETLCDLRPREYRTTRVPGVVLGTLSLRSGFLAVFHGEFRDLSTSNFFAGFFGAWGLW